jgi:hypothetical protein
VEYTLDDGCDDDDMCHPCAHDIAEGRISSMVSARDLTIRDLRGALRELRESAASAQPPDYESVARGHAEDLVSGRLPPEDVASNIAEDLRRAWKSGRSPQ